ncbi:Acetyl-CoA hydrolase [Zalerion maritima]|uniref:Acetyl-CoA hydrolase n=1 Tax=Zalerion maritima TaxID=339359 RepID=A0AAD5RJ78_9PEZI|nr:Acetyl-CoA hydrolase [Zalerion maritima]
MASPISNMLRARVRRPSMFNKLCQPEDTLKYFPNGAYIGWSGFTGVGYPKKTPTFLADHVERNNLQGKLRYSLFVGASSGAETENRWAALDMIERRSPHQVGKAISKGINEGRINFFDKHLSMFPVDLVYGFYTKDKPTKGLDVVVVEATDILEDGSIVPGASVGATPELVQMADKVIIEVNTALPSFEGLHDITMTDLPPRRKPYLIMGVEDRIGTTSIPIDPEKVVAVIESDYQDQTLPNTPADEGSYKIAGHLIEFLEHEVSQGRLPKNLLPIQSGIGNIANAVIGGLNDSKFQNLKVWTEVIQDTFLDLFDSGKLDFATATSIRFSPDGFHRFYSNWETYHDKLLLRAQQVSNSPEIIRRLGVIGMNTPVEVDIYAHANSTCVMGSRMLNGLGGSADFLRSSKYSIMHTPSTRPSKTDPHGVSCIVPMCTHVDQTEHDLDCIVTEQGLADVRGLSPRERAKVIIDKCAHPNYRPILKAYYEKAEYECLKKGWGHEPHMLFNTFDMHKALIEEGSMAKASVTPCKSKPNSAGGLLMFIAWAGLRAELEWKASAGPARGRHTGKLPMQLLISGIFAVISRAAYPAAAFGEQALADINSKGQSGPNPEDILLTKPRWVRNHLEIMEALAPATVAAGAAAATAAIAYLDAKFHLGKDIKAIRLKSWVGREWNRAVKQQRCSLYYFLEDAARTRGNEQALWSRVGCYTWTEALDRAHQYGQFFLSKGVKPGDLVALIMRNTPDFMLTWMGLFSIGAAPAMINHHLTGKALLHCLDISTANLVFVDGDDHILERINEVRGELEGEGTNIVMLDDVRDQIYNQTKPERPGDELRNGVNGGSPMALFYTSGTTGFPKACILPTAYGFQLGLGNTWENYPVETPQRVYCCMPYYHGTGGITSMAQLLNGATLCVGPKFSVSRFWQDIRDSEATWFVYVGETVRYLLSAPPSPLDKEHNVHSIYGNGLRPDVWDRFKERFGLTQVYEMFNQTEGMLTLANPSNNDFTAHSVGHHGALLRLKYHNLLVPVAVDAESGDILRNEKGFAQRVPYEEGGEILIKIPGEKVFSGYFNNPEATKKKYIHHVFKKGDCYYRTGDCLRRDRDGRWYFMDRLGDTFRWKGENVSTAEVSEILGKYPGVLEANVYGVQLPSHDGRAGAVAITIDPAVKHSFDHEHFLKHARSKLPKYAVPIFVRHVANQSAMHNNKQNKMPLKVEGVHPEKVQGGDTMFWIGDHGKGRTYIPFTKEDWDDLHFGKAKL